MEYQTCNDNNNIYLCTQTHTCSTFDYCSKTSLVTITSHYYYQDPNLTNYDPTFIQFFLITKCSMPTHLPALSKPTYVQEYAECYTINTYI